MAREYERYQELLKTTEAETEILKNGVVADIFNFNIKKEMVLLSLNMALEMRTSAVDKLAAYLHLDEPASMTQIITCARNQIRKNLMDYQEKFAGLIAQIDKVNKMNKNLITFSLTHINNTINYINSLTPLHPNYSPSGQIKAGKLQGKLISQAG